MMSLGSLAFAAPWILLGVAVLPILWWLLRVTPPAPKRVIFPALRLLRDLVPREETPAKTPLSCAGGSTISSHASCCRECGPRVPMPGS